MARSTQLSSLCLFMSLAVASCGNGDAPDFDVGDQSLDAGDDSAAGWGGAGTGGTPGGTAGTGGTSGGTAGTGGGVAGSGAAASGGTASDAGVAGSGVGGSECGGGFHDCEGVCKPNDSVGSCGAACVPCPTDPNGDPTCDGSKCGLSCHADHLLCDGICAPCPANAAVPGCQADTCVALICADGYHVCSNSCVSNTDPSTCGISCTPCPAPTNGSATCDQGACGVACNGGTILCSGACLTESAASCGPTCAQCPGAANGVAACINHTCAIACNPGYSACGGSCCPWTTELVANGYGVHVALRISGSDDVHVALMGGSSSQTGGADYSVIHGERLGSSWNLDSIASVSYAANDNPKTEYWGVAMALSSGVPFVAYKRRRYWTTGSHTSEFRVAARSGTAWTSDVVESISGYSECGIYPPLSLQADGAGLIHALFQKDEEYTSRAPRYGVRDLSGNWTFDDPPSAAKASLTVESNGMAHVLGASGGPLIEHTKMGTTWTSIPITTDYLGSVFTDARIGAVVTDAQSGVHVCYQSGSNGYQLSYGRKTATGWAIEVADPAANTGQYCAIAVDSQGLPLICYRDEGQTSVKCARKSGASWLIASVSNPGDAGEGIDVAFDSQDRPHLVFYERDQRAWYYMH